MKSFLAALLWLAVAASALLAQSLPSDTTPTRATLSGVVTKEPGSESVKKALIELIAESQGDGSNYTALTGPDGGFHIENIAPGRYRLFAERTGYQEVDKHHHRADGRLLTISAGQEIKDLVIHLQAAAVITGRITDEDGDPMSEAQVAVLRQTFASGHSRWEQVGAERTNDLGEYRIAALAAGNYFVAVTPPPDFRSLIETSGSSAAAASTATANKTPLSVYQTTFYPGTRDRGQAQPIQLHAGDEFPVNFSLTPSPSLSIRGTVVNLPQGATAAIMLQSKDFNGMLNGAEMHKDGSFEVRDISPGSYTILATIENAPVPMIARQMIEISSANLEGIRLAPQPGGTIRGRLRLEPAANPQIKADSGMIFLMLHSADSDDDSGSTFNVGNGFSPLTQVNLDGSFEWKNVPAGNYFVQLSDAGARPGYFLKSALASGRDVNESGINASGGTIMMDLLASPNGASIDGVVMNDKNEPVVDAVVVAVPEARFRSHPDRFHKVSTDQQGHFMLRSLPPGDYTLLAWEALDGDAYLNPEFLKKYEGQGKALHTRELDHVSTQLAVIADAQGQD
jgi:carboxypeptidase family protein